MQQRCVLPVPPAQPRRRMREEDDRRPTSLPAAMLFACDVVAARRLR